MGPFWAITIPIAIKTIRPGIHHDELAQWPGLASFRATVFAGITWVILAPVPGIAGLAIDPQGTHGWLGTLATSTALIAVVAYLTLLHASLVMPSILEGEGVEPPS